MADEHYDIFISWAHADGEENILQVKHEIIENYKRFAPDAEELKIFTDHAIECGDDWEEKIASALSHSDLFIAILSPNFFKSDYCSHEMHLWKNKEIREGALNKASLPIYYIRLAENLFASDNKAVKEAFAQQTNAKLEPWFNEGENYLYEEEIKRRIAKELTSSDLDNKLRKIRTLHNSFTNIQHPNRDFVGRVTELTDIRRKFAEMPERIPLLHGAAGVGKTEVAFAYSYAYASEYPGGRYVIKAEGVKNIPDALSKLAYDTVAAEELGIDTETFTDNEKRDSTLVLRDRIRPALLKKNGETRGRVLIILDNVDDPYAMLKTPDIDKYLSWRKGETIHIIATTRKDSLTTTENEPACPYCIDEMAEHDALELFRVKRLFDNDDEKTAAKEIIDFIGGNAWALAIIAESLKHNKRYSYRRKADSLKQLKNIEYIREKDAMVETRHGAISTEELLKPTLELLSEEERWVADYASLLHPDYVYMPWLKGLYIKEYTKDKNTDDTENDWLDIAEKLEQLHILSVTDANNCARMHRLSRYVLRKQLDNNECNEMAKTLTARANIASCRVECDSAQRFFEDLLVWRKEILGENHPYTLASMENLAATYLYLGDYEKSLKLMKELLSKRKEQLGEDDPSTLMLMNVIAMQYLGLGMYSEAVELQETVLLKNKDKFGEQHKDTLCTKFLLAMSYDALGRYDEAAKLREEAIVNKDELSDKDIFVSYLGVYAVAMDYLSKKKYSEAAKLFEEASRKHIAVFGKNHAASIQICVNLALCYAQLDRYDEAIKLLEDALYVSKTLYGDKHPQITQIMQCLAFNYSNQGRQDKAARFLEDALNQNLEFFGDNHPDTMLVMRDLAKRYVDLGKVKEAIDLQREVLAKYCKRYGQDHSDTISAMYELANTYTESGKYYEALKLRKRILYKMKTIYGEKHNNTQKALLDVVCCYSLMGRYEKAIKLIESTIAEQSYDLVLDGMVRSKLGRIKEVLALEEIYVEANRRLQLDAEDMIYHLEMLEILYKQFDRAPDARKARAEIEDIKAKQAENAKSNS